MRTENPPDPDYLRQRLTLDPDTGRLTWRENPLAKNCWNARWVGREAFTASFKGYRTGRIDGKQYLAHRMVWALHHGVWPTGQIDHINGDRGDNRVTNLRVVSNTQNARNATLSKSNKSGVTGVWWDARRNYWCAEIKVNRRKIHLGYFSTLEEAATVRKQAEARYGFHANHGKRSVQDALLAYMERTDDEARV